MDLPRPVTTDELYLAAILEELRTLRAELSQIREAARRPVAGLAAPPSDAVVSLTPEGPGHLVDRTPVKPPRRRKAGG